jgi:hypothetical protein
MSYHIYCLNYGDKRTATITASFAAVGLSDKVTFCPGISMQTLKEANNNRREPRHYFYMVCSILLGHISMIQHYLDTSDEEFAIFCENDIRIHRDIKKKLPDYLSEMKKFELDILRLGYFVRSGIYLTNLEHITPTIFKNRGFLEIYGAQMYILTRAQCEKYVKKYTMQYFLANQFNPQVSYYPDNTVVVDGNMAVVYPMLAIEYIPDDWVSEHGDNTEYQRDSCKFNLTDDYL